MNLIQDTRAIECRAQDAPKAGFDRLELDAKESLLKLSLAGKSVAEFEQLKFLDSAVLLKRKGKRGSEARDGESEVTLFQVKRDGDVVLFRGGLFPFEEKNCDDTGASKLCKNKIIDRLVWTPEKLEFQTKKVNFQGAISQYGVFTGRGTFFIGESAAPGGEPHALVLLDYGAKVDLVFGQRIRLECKYPGDQ